MENKVLLNKRYKEILFAAAGFGPNLLMALMMAYFTDAVIPTGLQADINFWSYAGVTIVYTAIFPIFWTIGRIFDGMIDVPLAALTDNFKNKKNRRWFGVLISVLPMLISFVFCWWPVFGQSPNMEVWRLIGNSIWIFVWSVVFFASYTLGLITFYGSLSEVCENQTQRARVSAYKSVFDTISYALVYAAIPAIFKAINVPIHRVAMYLSPLMLTIIIPVFLVRKSDSINDTVKTDVSIGSSFVLTMRSKPFMKWLIVNCLTFFGLQMFLVSQNALISGVMNLNAWQAAILNTCAFGPVPLMLFLFNRGRKKKGIRFMYQTCIIAFSIGILCLCFGSQYFWGDAVGPKLIIGGIGSVIGSWGIAGFFMVPYLIPTTIASVEEEVSKKNHSAMYFAVQALMTSFVGAIASSLVYNYLKLWVIPTPEYEWKAGVSLVPLIVIITGVAAFMFCFLMPKRYSARTLYYEMREAAVHDILRLGKKQKKLKDKLQLKKTLLDSHIYSDEEKKQKREEYDKKYNKRIMLYQNAIDECNAIINFKFTDKLNASDDEDRLFENDSVAMTILLFILTLGLYGVVVLFVDIGKLKKLGVKVKGYQYLLLILSLFIPFLNIYTTKFFVNHISNEANKRKIKVKLYLPLNYAASLLIPGFLNIISLAIRTNAFNNISDDIFYKEKKI